MRHDHFSMLPERAFSPRPFGGMTLEGMFSFVGDFFGGVGDVVGDIFEGVGDVVEGAVDTIEDLGSSIDDLVHDVIPGDWKTLAAIAAATVGLPTDFGLTEAAAAESMIPGIEGFAGAADMVGGAGAGLEGIAGLEGFAGAADMVGGAGAGLEGISGLEGFANAADMVGGAGAGLEGIPGIEGFANAADMVGGAGAGLEGISGIANIGSYIPGIEGFAGAADMVGGAGSNIGGLTNVSSYIPGIEGFFDAADMVGGAGVGAGNYIPGIEGFFDAADMVGGAGSGTYIPGIQGFANAADEVGGAGAGPYVPKANVKDVLNAAKTAKTVKDLFNKINMGQAAGLLGGLAGYKYGYPTKPRGYTGGIPKYTAQRIPKKGVIYTKAAEGGLMGLASGGAAQPARYLRGGTDGMADKIKTDIDGKQPARLSHGEFVVPADVVSHLGNGNSDAGADVLYEMMAKVRKARTGKSSQGKQINPRKYTPA